MDYPKILNEINAISKDNPQEFLLKVCETINHHGKNYNWVGFYFMDHQEKVLRVGPYVGAKTDHTVIPFGRGICGQVAESGQTLNIEDVHAEENYLACSIETKSEIVVPIYRNNELIGQIDIDAHVVNAFSDEDEKFLKSVCEIVAPFCP